MEAFCWDDYYKTGLSTVDNQHKNLVDIINQFGGLLSEDKVRIDDVDELFKELSSYASYHFQEEVRLMTENRVDARFVSYHVSVHNSFLEEVTSIYFDVTEDKIGRAIAFLRFLTQWLAYHMLGVDHDMAKQISSINSGVSPKDAYENLEREKAKVTGPLIKALNGLFDQVTARNKQLRQLNESLEEKVNSRTQELSEANRRLEELSLTDALTGVHNRRYAMKYLPAFWEEALQYDFPLVCMMIDADNFKEVNDNYGHDAGDKLLAELAKTLVHNVRSDDIVCRLGGDEFFIICPHTDKEGGMRKAESIRNAVSKLVIETGGKPWLGSVSIGVASRSSSMKSHSDLIKEADKGVYAAKGAGKNSVRTTGGDYHSNP